jgi:hypothetical protein
MWFKVNTYVGTGYVYAALTTPNAAASQAPIVE